MPTARTRHAPHGPAAPIATRPARVGVDARETVNRVNLFRVTPPGRTGSMPRAGVNFVNFGPGSTAA